MIPAFLAPLLAQGLSLVGNAVLAKGKEWVEEKAGVKLQPNMSDEDMLKLRQFEMDHEEELLKLQLEQNKLDLSKFEMELKDTADARDREVQIATSDKAPLLNKVITPALAIAIVVLTFVLFGIVMFQKVPVDPSRKDILIYVLGVLSAVATQVVSYYFGSSSGSNQKNDILKDAIK